MPIPSDLGRCCNCLVYLSKDKIQPYITNEVIGFMKSPNDSPVFVIKWEIIQVLFCMLFLALFYLQEMAATRFIGQNYTQVQIIHNFLNSLQFLLLPDFFFFLFVPLILISFGYIIFKKWRWFFLSFSGALISVLYVADRIYCSFFSSLITIRSLSAAGQVWAVKSAILASIMPKDVLFILAFCVFIFFGVLYNKKIKMGLPEGKLAFTIDKIIGILIFVLAIYAYNIAFYIPKRYVTIGDDHVIRISETKIEGKGMWHSIPIYETSNRSYADSFGLLNFHFKNLTDVFKDRLLKKSAENLPFPEGIHDFFDEKRKINEVSSPFYGIAKRRNVFLIHFESLHPILIGADIGGLPVTPTLNQLEKNSLYWNNILDQVTIGGSSDAEFSSLTGMLAGTEQISAFNSSSMAHIPALPRQLKSIGYQTISLHGYKISFWNRSVSQPLLGFETMYFEKAFKFEDTMGLGISDMEFFSQSIDLLKGHTSPFFAFLMTLTSHYPYEDIPANYRHLFRSQVEPDSVLINYLQAIRYSDDALGEFFLKIRNEGFWENSIFVIYGDHMPGGSSEQMSDALMKVTGKSLLNPRYACVPIMIVIPGHEDLILENKKLYSNIVGGLYDIFPTIMHLLGENSPLGVFGSHLFVQNIQRDSVPVFRFMDGFVFNGIHYRQQGKVISRDDMGLVFTNDVNAVIKTDIERLNQYKKALLSTFYCNYIYRMSVDISSFKTTGKAKG